MRILTSTTLPSVNELTEILKQEFSPRYSYELFGLGSEKTIMVQKSAFVGAQITRTENEITVQATPPSLISGYFLGFLEVTGLAVILVLFGITDRSAYMNFEKEIAGFFKRKYN